MTGILSSAHTKRGLVTAGAVALLSPLFAPIFWIAQISYVPTADACRDCPFPMKIAEGRWLMPNKRMEVEIFESKMDRGRTVTVIWLIQAETGDVLAVGSAQHQRGRRLVPLVAKDRQGNSILTRIRWLDDKHEQMQINFTCPTECAIRDLLD